MKGNKLAVTTATLSYLFLGPTSYTSTQNVASNPQSYFSERSTKKMGFEDMSSTKLVTKFYDANRHSHAIDAFSNLEQIASELFGDMREATREERDSVDKYLSSLVVKNKNELNFFDLC